MSTLLLYVHSGLLNSYKDSVSLRFDTAGRNEATRKNIIETQVANIITENPAQTYPEKTQRSIMGYIIYSPLLSALNMGFDRQQNARVLKH